MSTRQNKKQRKGRNHANNRERTVTTLTEDPNTHYLVPTPSEEPGHISPSFVTSVVPPHNMSLGPQYPIAGNFSYGYTAPFSPVQHTNMHQQQQQQQQQPYYSASSQQGAQQPPTKPALPPGKSDLEILQNLKKLIIEGQHPFYRAVPSPAALASLYKGPIPVQSQPEQHLPGLSSSFGARDVDRRQPRRQVTDPRNQDKSNGFTGNGVKTTPSPTTVSTLSPGVLQISKDASGPSSADIQSGVSPHERISGSDSAAMNVDSPSHGDASSANVDQSRTQPTQAATPRSAVPPSADHGYGVPLERDTTTRPPRAIVSTSSHSPASFEAAGRRPATSQDDHKQKTYSPAREWVTNDHERRIVYERPSRDTRPSEPQRPAPHSEPHSQKADFARPPSVPQAPSEKTDPLDVRPEARPTAVVDAPQVPIPPPENVLSTREADAALAVVDSRLQENTGSDSVAPPSHYADRPSSDAEDVRSSREPSPHLPDAPDALSSVAPPASAESIPPVVENPAVPPPPSLKEHINSDQLVSRQTKPAGEQNAAAEHPSGPQQQDRFGKKNKFQRHHYNAPGKFGRQNTPDVPPPGSGGHAPRTFRPRSPSLDGRKPRDHRGPPPPPPTRDLSRDRAAYRAEYDPRRPEILEPDVPLSARYDKRPYGEFSAHPGSERRPSAYAGSPPPLSGGRAPPSVDAPLRHDYYAYPPPRSDWDMDDDGYYKSGSGAWDRPPPHSGDRERFERDPYGPRPGSWDARQEREFREPYPPGPPGAPMPPDDRYPPGPPMARDIDRSARPPPGYSAPYGRVRGRSPSPVGRAGLHPLDDVRPPMKRAREDFPGEYYPPLRAPPPPPPLRRPSGPEYPPPRSAGQGAGAEWPPPGSAGSGGGGGPPRGRQEYRPPGREPPMEYGGPPYERGPPGPPPSRMAYGANHGGMNDRGTYPPRPSQ